MLEEHRRVCSRYGGSYSVHVAIKKTLQYWAMLRIAAHIAVKDGPETLWDRFVSIGGADEAYGIDDQR
jgi:hypothetical protein